MFEVELRAAPVVRASEPRKSEGEAPVGKRGELASAGTSASPERGTELGVSENTPGSTSSLETDSSSSSGSGTGKLKSKPKKALAALLQKVSHLKAHKVQASSLSSAITLSLWLTIASCLWRSPRNALHSQPSAPRSSQL